MVKSLKDFRTYVLHSKIISYVPTSIVKDILVQPNSVGKRVRWLAKIHEFDLEVKSTKLVKGKSLAKLLAESNFRALKINHLESHGYLLVIEELDDQTPKIQIKDKFSSSVWYCYIVSYLLTLQCLKDMTLSKAGTLKLHTIKYCIIDG
jgi:hypothetical protein